KRVFGATKRFVVNRKEIREFSKQNRLLWTSTAQSNNNTITDISTEMNVFFERAASRPLTHIIQSFMPYLQSNIRTMAKPDVQRNILLIDSADYLFTKVTNPVQIKTNPIYLIYRIMKMEYERIKDWNMEIV